MDLITRNLKRTVSSSPATTVQYTTGSTIKDNVSNTALFTNTRFERLAVSPFTTISNETKIAETSDFTNYTQTPRLPSLSWGSNGSYHNKYALWQKEEKVLDFNGIHATNNDGSIIVVCDFAKVGPVKVSTDFGVTWVDSTSTFPGYFGGNIRFAEGKFWIVYYNGQGTWTSTDGMTWTTNSEISYSVNTETYYGAPNYTLSSWVVWNGSNYSNIAYSTVNNVKTQIASTTSAASIVVSATRTSGFVRNNSSLLFMGEEVWRVQWNGTSVVTTSLGLKFFGRFVRSAFFDSELNRWLVLVLGITDWSALNAIYTSYDDGDTWSKVADVPASYTNRTTILKNALNQIVISGNGGGNVVYNEATNTWIQGDKNTKLNLAQRINETVFITNQSNIVTGLSNRTVINISPSASEGAITSNRKWHGYTSGTGSIIQHFSSDGYVTYSNVTPTFTDSTKFTDPFIPNGNTGPSYITRNATTVSSRATFGVNYDSTHYLCTTDNSDSQNYSTRPFGTVNVWKSTDSGNNYIRTSTFAYSPTYYDTNYSNFAGFLPAWTDTDASNTGICYSRLIADPSYSTSLNLYNRVSSVSPAGINDMTYQDGAFWAWGHNGLLMTSPDGGTDIFSTSWSKFSDLQEWCLGSRIVSFTKEGSKLFVFTSLGQFFVSLNLGITWTDRTAAIRTAGLNTGVSSTYNIPMSGVVYCSTYTSYNGVNKIIAGASNGIYESTDDGVTWTKNSYNAVTNGIPSAIAKHPTTDVLVIGTQSGLVRVTSSALSTFAGITIASGQPISKIIWTGTRWYVFFDNTTTYGRYGYSAAVNPNTAGVWITPTAIGGSSALPTAQYIGGVSSTVVVTNAYWDGTRVLITDNKNNQIYVSNDDPTTWNNISQGIRGSSSSKFPDKRKHVWSLVSNGTHVIAAGDMCETAWTTVANILLGGTWSGTTLKNSSGVEDPNITFDTDYYVANVTVTSAGSGYSAAGTASMLYNLTLNCSAPSKPNGGVKPWFVNGATNNTNGGITFLTIDGFYSHGYTGTESTAVTLSGSYNGYTGSGFAGNLVFRKRPVNVRVHSSGKGFGPMNVTSPVYANDGACAEVYFMGNATSFVPSASNIVPMKIIIGDRVSQNLQVNLSSGFPYINMVGNDQDNFVYAKTRTAVYQSSISRNSGTSRTADAATASRASEDGGKTWRGNFFHRHSKPMYANTTSMTVLNNVGYPVITGFVNEKFSRASIDVVTEGFTYNSNFPKMIYSGYYLESNGTNIECYPFVTPGILLGSMLRVDDTRKNLIEPLRSTLGLTLTGSQVTEFSNTNPTNARNIYTNWVTVSDNSVDELALANTIIVFSTKPTTTIGTGASPSQTLDDMFWYYSTNGGTSWADMSAPIRTAVTNLVKPAGAVDTQYVPSGFRWSKDDNLWYGTSGGLAYWTSPDLNTWTVVQDPAGTWTQYPN